jgi:NhaP-type Na+/H+ or K+/H+ antiporter
MTLLVIFLVLVFLFSLVSGRVERSVVTGPMVFAAAGLLVYSALPEACTLEITSPVVQAVAELTLAVALFSAATHTSLREVTRESQLPIRLLGIGMPLAILAGTLVAVLLLGDIPLWEAAILATVLAPTDDNVAPSVVNSRLVPPRIRQALDVESGLNDAVCLPLLVLFIALSGVRFHGEQSWLVFTAWQIGFGLLVGLGLGWLGGLLMTRAEGRGWMAQRAKQLAMLALAVLSWGLAEHALGGNGFIAAFVAGGALRMRYEDAHQHMTRFDKAWGDFLVYMVFFAFGVIVAPELGSITAGIWLYALLSLTLVRLLPVALSLVGTRLQPASVLFVGWFGPRGLASIILGLVYLEKQTRLSVNSTIVLAMMAAVLLSVLAHGVSANPAIRLYAGRVADLTPDAPEYA